MLCVRGFSDYANTSARKAKLCYVGKAGRHEDT